MIPNDIGAICVSRPTNPSGNVLTDEEVERLGVLAQRHDIPLIIDCGTGLREFGGALSREFAGRPMEGHIFVGHTHWDHIQGFPFFTPLYNPANSFSLYSVRGAHSSLRSLFSDSMSLDYFPVPLAGLGGKIKFVELFLNQIPSLQKAW